MWEPISTTGREEMYNVLINHVEWNDSIYQLWEHLMYKKTFNINLKVK